MRDGCECPPGTFVTLSAVPFALQNGTKSKGALCILARRKTSGLATLRMTTVLYVNNMKILDEVETMTY